MPPKDHAIVVGIRRCPALGDLNGPENDARDFEQWLLDPAGGDVPPANVRRILSSDFAPNANPLDDKPTTAELESAFDALYDRGDQNGGKTGRRLYVYLAGHG